MANQIIPVRLTEVRNIGIEISSIRGDQDIAIRIPSLDSVLDDISEISKKVMTAIQAAQPQKASVEFGLEIGIESGGLTALIAKGTGSASFKVTLEWSKT